MNQLLTIDLRQLVPASTFDEAARAVGDDVGQAGGGRWKRAMASLGGSKIAEAMNEKLQQIDILASFARGWAESKDLLKASEEADVIIGKTKFIRLGKFEHNLDIFPLMTFSAMGMTSDPIKMTLTFQAEFEAVEVGLTRGYLVEVGGGFCKLSAILKYGQFSFPAGIAPMEFQLGDARRFADPGIKITGKPATTPAA